MSVPPEPAPERPTSLADLGFQRKPMVRWFSPAVLFTSAMRVVVSTLFGEYADKRDFQAALDPDPGPPVAYGAADEEDGALWLDFVADLGDGFDSTYAMACLLGRRHLQVKGAEGSLPRGRLLVMGGDEVYPVASRGEYEDRFRGPYTAALPATPGTPPHLYAIPGNHDWYDGLTNFLRFFCAEREIGAWQTRQSRSYFALRLPHDWWLLAIDIQLDTYIDEPQLKYFRQAGLKQGDRVILVTGKPSWVKVKPGEVPDSYRNVEYFTEKVIAEAGAEVWVTLSGDLHHYCRYRAADDSHHFVTSGGGGAYLFPTHTMPETLELPEGHYEKTACFPAVEESENLTKGARRMPWLAPGLCTAIGVLYGAFAVSLFAAIAIGPGWAVLSAVVALVIVSSLIGFSAGETKEAKRALGGVHALAHLLLATATVAVALLISSADWMLLPLFVAAVLVGYLGGGFLLGEYLIRSHRHAERHANDVLACQGIPDYKNFLRLRLDADGLTIYPIGIRRVPRQWEATPDSPAEEPWLRPVDLDPEPELLEAPFTISGARS